MLGVHCENGDLVDELIQSYVSQGKLTPTIIRYQDRRLLKQKR